VAIAKLSVRPPDAADKLAKLQGASYPHSADVEYRDVMGSMV